MQTCEYCNLLRPAVLSLPPFRSLGVVHVLCAAGQDVSSACSVPDLIDFCAIRWLGGSVGWCGHGCT